MEKTYTAVSFERWVRELVRETPRFIAIDGRGGAGKSTLAAQLAEHLGAPVVHVDDVSWNYSRFDWADELKKGIVDPLLRGLDVNYVPPGWKPHGRTGAIVLPGSAPVVLIEGTGIIRPEFDWKSSVWVAGDMQEQRQRCIDRGEDPAFFDAWQEEEIPFLEHMTPWAYATWIVDGSDVMGDTLAVARLRGQKEP